MGYDPRRAALIACCVLAVVVAGSHFPAAGYGDYPDSDAVDSGYYVDGSADGAPADAVGESTETGTETPAETETPDRTGTETPDRTETPERTETETPERTETDPGTAGGSDGDSPGGGLVRGLLFLGVCGIALVAFAEFGGRRWGSVDPDALPSGTLPRLRFRLRRIPQVTMAAALGASRTMPSLAAGAGRALGTAGGLFGTIALDVGRGLGKSLATVPTALSALGGGFGGLFSLSSGPSSLLSGARSRVRSVRSGTDGDAPTVRDSDPGEPPAEPDLGPLTIEEAWEEMVDDLRVRRRRARTPGELARRAVDRGLPAEPVSTLTDAFREVRYGGFPPAPERTRRAREAFERIERARADDEDGGDGR